MLRIPFITKSREVDANFRAIQQWAASVMSALPDHDHDVPDHDHEHSHTTFESLTIGDTTNYSGFSGTGTLRMYGAATTFLDELGDITKLKSNNPTRITDNANECGVDFATSCTTSDFIYTNVQINHDWLAGSNIYPHLHWQQNAANLPHWVFSYRWQRQGGAKTTTWTSVKADSQAFSYSSGTINQIAVFPAITPPSGYNNVSDILQCRITRDNSNASGLFTGADPYSGAATALSFDVHKEVDTLGSNTQYDKY